jgi:prepilin-type N-terminal cleavage/methylation domain-containing protein/prepilin-type processing-associated H-X9-DG protein
MRRNSRFCERGFSLIELLAVISILSILLALLIPAVQRVRESSRRLVCQNNLRNICTAVHSYLVDHHGSFPKAAKANQAGGWAIAILVYMEQKSLASQICANPSLNPMSVPPSVRERPLIYTCPDGSARESAIPGIPVSHYVAGKIPNEKHWQIADAPASVRNPWLTSPEFPYYDRPTGKGPHEGGFNIGRWDGSVAVEFIE